VGTNNNHLLMVYFIFQFLFTDIVGFSRIAMGVTPIKVMNMLQNLFNRFDRLCDVHGVMKLETIGA